MTAPSLSELRLALSAAGADDPRQPPHARAFAAWIQMGSAPEGKILRVLAEEAAALDGAARQTAHVAVLGYAAQSDPIVAEPFRRGLEWLQQRQYFAAGRPLTFEVDGLALLGTAVGTQCLSDAERGPAQQWLGGILRLSLRSSPAPDWNHSLIAAAFAVVGIVMVPELSAQIAADLLVALVAKSLMPASAANGEAAWCFITGPSCLADGMTRAAAQA